MSKDPEINEALEAIEPETPEEEAEAVKSEASEADEANDSEQEVQEDAEEDESDEDEEEEKPKETPSKSGKSKKRKLSGGVIAIIVAVIAALGAVGYLVARNMPGVGPYALKINKTEYSLAQVNYEYMTVFQQYSQYSAYFGSVMPSDPYTMGDTTEYATWGDFYMDQTKDRMTQLTNLCDMAERDGVTLDKEEIASIDDWIASLSDYADAQGMTLDAFLSTYFGEGVTIDVIRDMTMREALASKYAQHYQESLTFTPEEIDAAYDADPDAYDTYRFRYYMVVADADDEGNVSDEAMAAAKEQAESIAAAAQAGEGEAADRLDAAINSEEASVPAEMDGSTLTQYQVPFEAWLKDPARTAGEITVSEQPGYGYFIVLFESRERSETPTVNVRHILIQAEDADGDGVCTEEELAAAKAQVEQIKAEWESGEQTEERFGELATQYTDDPGSASTGGLYENVYEGQMVEEFNDFCFAPGRQPGDVEIIEDATYQGYHLMYFVGQGESYTALVIKDQLTQDKVAEFSETITKADKVIEGRDYPKVSLSSSYLAMMQQQQGLTLAP